LTNYQVVCFGEVLWDILPNASLPGGAPMNVAYHLNKLGIRPAMITRTGNDDYGKKLAEIFSASGLSTEYFQLDAHHTTGLVYAKPDENNDMSYDIVNPSAWDFIEWKNELRQLMESADFFVFGSLSARNKTSGDTLYELLQLGATNVCDINLRPPNFTQAHIEYLLHQTQILKMNFEELEIVSDWFGKFKTAEDRIKIIQDRFGIKTVIVTMGAEGAMVKDNGTIYRHPGLRVEVADTIGSGDAFLAGFLSRLIAKSPIENALAFASALGAFVASCNGGCPAYEVSQVEELMNKT
jgi:fructokinase